MDEILDGSEVIIVGNKAPEFASALENARQGQVVIDLVRIKENSDGTGAEYNGICW
jgi:hypothetical protein